jgi:hypothetical protein
MQPDFDETELLLDELLKDVRKWEGTLAGGTQLEVGGAAVDSLFQTKVSFGNPKDNLTALTPASFATAGVALTELQQSQLDQFDFYFMTLNVNLAPKPGAQFKALTCRLSFGPKGSDEPIIQTILPENKWRSVLTWGGGLKLKLDANLQWAVSVDASMPENIDLPAEFKAAIADENALSSFINLPDFAYEAGKFDITATGKGNSECYWHIQEPDLQKMTDVQFVVIFKVPTGTPEITLEGLAWAEPDMNWLIASVRNVFRDLQDKLQQLLKGKQDSAAKFARGARESWTLKLK